jgi:hypothetical protein
MKVAVDLKQVVTFSQTMFSWDMRRYIHYKKILLILSTKLLVLRKFYLSRG